MIAQKSIDTLKERLDIVDVVGSYFELKKNGANFKTNCPFHNEDTPSFVISPKKQICHCFGCGAGGDSIKFVMDYENLSYSEALESLAKKFNYTLEYTNEQEKKVNTEVMKRLSDYFISLRSPDLLTYLHNRGLSDESIETWEIGLSPSSMQSIKYINENLLDKEALLEFGVINKREDGSLYNRFAKRLIFPIYSHADKIIGFNGRILENGEPKYINSPQTRYFNKSTVLFGFNKARKAIYNTNKCIVTEGCFDVALLHQIGLTHSVATLGTALGINHLPKLRQINPYIILAYDGDKAGKEAAFKAAWLLAHEGFDGGVVLFPFGADPADMIRDGKDEEVKKLLASPTSFIPYVLDTIIKRYDITNPMQKSSALKDCLEFTKGLSALLQDEYAIYLSKMLNIDARHTHQAQKQPKQEATTTEDMAELIVLKALALNEERINTAVELMDESCFFTHKDLYEALLRDDELTIRTLACRLDIPELSEDELRKQYIVLIMRRYMKYLAYLKGASMPHKITKINTVALRLKSLKEGKLVHWGTT